jgi:hypothetical protein
MEHTPLPGKLNERMIVNGELKRKEDVVLAILRKQNSDK